MEEQIVQVLETPDYTELLQSIHSDLEALQEIGGYIEGFLVFGVVVALCYFSYRFLRIFF